MAQKVNTQEQTQQTPEKVRIKIVSVKEVTTEDGHKFNTFKTVDKKGKFMDVRFTRECKTLPTEPCTIVVKSDMANVAKNRQFPCVWVKEIEAIEETAFESNIGEYFGE